MTYKKIIRNLSGVLFALVLCPLAAHAVNVQLQPGYINGTISIGGIPLIDGTITANSTTARVGSATNGFINGSTGTGSFALTVNTPLGGSQDYIVKAANINVSSPTTRGIITLPAQTVAVADGQSTQVNFNVNPVIVQGNVAVSGVAMLRGSISATFVDAGGNQVVSTTPVQADGSFSFPVLSNNAVQLTGAITTVDGQTVYLTPKVVNVVTGMPMTNLNWSVAITPQVPASRGTISGTVNFAGSLVRGITVLSSRGRTSTTRVFPGSYTHLVGVGTHRMTAYTSGNVIGGFRVNRLTLPLSSHSNPVVTVAGGQTSIDNITAEAAFLMGTLSLTGSNVMPDLLFASVNAVGSANSLTAGGRSNAAVGMNGAYKFLITPGNWSVAQGPYLKFLNTNPSNYLKSILTIQYAQGNGLEPPVTVGTGQTATSNLNIAVGTVTLNFSVAGGGMLSNSFVSGSMRAFDPVSGAYTHSARISGFGQATPATSGQVKLVGVPGLYTLRPSATVNGSTTTFPAVQVRIVSGADAVVDIGAPTLNVLSPQPGAIVNAGSLLVSGTATDDTGVDSVVVNGVRATLTSTNNPSDLNEIAFTASIPAVQGSNSILTVATDAGFKSARDTRSVTVNLNRAPLANAGADMQLEQTSPAGASVVLNGTASSDPDGNVLSYSWNGPFGSAVGVSPTVNVPAGVSNVNLVVNDGTVNSAPDTAIYTVVDSIAPTFNAQPVNISKEATSLHGTVVSYGLPVVSDAADPAPAVACQPATGSVFAVGDTAVSCTATDASGNSSSTGFAVSVTDTTVPVLALPADVSIEANAVLSTEALGAVTATDIFGATVANDAPAAGFPLGTTTVTYTATDGNGLTSTGTQTVTVVDTTAPVLTLPADVSVEANAVLSTVAIGSATATDIFAVTIMSDAPATYALGTTLVTWTATDVNGNATTGTQTVTVVDTTAPVLTVPANVSVEANAVLSTVVIGTASATDIFGATVANNAPATFALGTTIVTYTATDANGLITTGTQAVTVVDTTAPVLTLPADVSVEANGVLSTVAIGAATATDLFGATVTSNAPATFPLGTTQVTWRATDGNGNTVSAVQRVSVVDTTAPVVTATLLPYSEGDGGHDGHHDSDEGRFMIQFQSSDAVDANPVVTAELVIQGNSVPVSVVNGQIIEFEYEHEKTQVETEKGVLEIEAPSMLLRVTVTDASGNSTQVTAQPRGLTDDNDDEQLNPNDD